MPEIRPKQIKAARALAGWSQRQLAEKAGVDVNVIARFEREEVDPRSSTLGKIERALKRAGVVLMFDNGGYGVRIIERGRS